MRLSIRPSINEIGDVPLEKDEVIPGIRKIVDPDRTDVLGGTLKRSKGPRRNNLLVSAKNGRRCEEGIDNTIGV